MYLRLRLRENLIRLLQRRTDFVLYATDLIDYAVSKMMNSQERKRERERERENASKTQRKERERMIKGEKGRRSEETRMPNKKDSNDNSVSFVSPQHSINDGGNKGRLMSLRSAAVDRQENGDFERKIIF